MIAMTITMISYAVMVSSPPLVTKRVKAKRHLFPSCREHCSGTILEHMSLSRQCQRSRHLGATVTFVTPSPVHEMMFAPGCKTGKLSSISVTRSLRKAVSVRSKHSHSSASTVSYTHLQREYAREDGCRQHHPPVHLGKHRACANGGHRRLRHRFQGPHARRAQPFEQFFLHPLSLPFMSRMSCSASVMRPSSLYVLSLIHI